jgi:hypothetical protein
MPSSGIITMPSRCAHFAPALMLSLALIGACKSDDGDGGSVGGGAAVPAAGAAAGGSTGTGGAGATEAGAGGARGDNQGVGGSTTAECQGSGLGSRLCAAFEARRCGATLDCLACVADAREQRRPYEGCAACALAFDAWYQCAVSAFEAGDVANGVHCVGGHAEAHPRCASYLAGAIECNVAAEKGCPQTWPR